MNRWWTYQRERFPVLAHGPLILAFSTSAVSYSSLLRGDRHPALLSFAVAFVVSFGSFLLLRIADEFKDAEEDARYRPYRPVPRGLVTLRELAAVGAAVAIIQVSLAALIGPTLIGLLAITWIYFALMTREFFAREWLKARPVIYLLSHMLIMPLVDWFATGCDWAHAGGAMPAGLAWFLAASFFNGIVIEIGRKIRAPAQEEAGVDTYTALWGRTIAVTAWLAAMASTAACAFMAATRIKSVNPVAVVLGGLIIASVVLGVRFVQTLHPKLAKSFELASGIWSLALYLTLGLIPLLIKR